MAQLQKVRGTKDLLPEDNRVFRAIDNTARHLASRYGFDEIQTPIFESSEVFHRTLGESTDIITKETYTFLDRGGESVTLRPEGTAGIARAFITEGLAQNLPLKFYYVGPMFRYERPQKGRQRQFHQIGVECLGIEAPYADVECIALGWRILKALDVAKRCRLELNTLGDFESRKNYRDALVIYFSEHKSKLSADSLLRLEKNPLRILDSKDEGDRRLIEEAPQFESYLNEHSKNFFAKVCAGLTDLDIPFTLNSHLVRGLDYYSHTVFEMVTEHLGAQGAVLSGGRYDGLIESMGGPKTAGVGWAGGMERLAELTNPAILADPEPLYVVVPADEFGELYSLRVQNELIQLGLRCEIIWSGGNVGKKFKKADKMKAAVALIVGQKETQDNTVTAKNLKTGIQKTLPIAEIRELLNL